MIGAHDLALVLARRIEPLVADLLPAGHREGPEWRCGSLGGKAGNSLGVHLTGSKAGVWSDFATGDKGDALDLVRHALDLDMLDAMGWARSWLRVDNGEAPLPARPVTMPPACQADDSDPARWRRPWQAGRPIDGTLAELYLHGRQLHFGDPDGRVLRFCERRARKNPSGAFERHPAMLAALCDIKTGAQVGIINIHLLPDGCDRLRDSKGKTATGRAAGSAVMLSDFADVTMGLAVCEGVETGIALLMREQAPVWACGGAGNLGKFPLLGGIEALTICADADPAGERVATELTERWRAAQRKTVTISPPGGDWAHPRATP